MPKPQAFQHNLFFCEVLEHQAGWKRLICRVAHSENNEQLATSITDTAAIDMLIDWLGEAKEYLTNGE
jgi:hypothetical protein